MYVKARKSEACILAYSTLAYILNYVSCTIAEIQLLMLFD